MNSCISFPYLYLCASSRLYCSDNKNRDVPPHKAVPAVDVGDDICLSIIRRRVEGNASVTYTCKINVYLLPSVAMDEAHEYPVFKEAPF